MWAQPEGEGVVIDDKSWQPWYVLYILPDCMARLAAPHTMATVLYYISYLIGPTSGNVQEWNIKPQRIDYHF